MPIPSNAPALPVLLLLAAAVALPLLGLVRRRWVMPAALLVQAAAASISALNLAAVLRSGTIRMTMGGWFPPIGIEYVLDHLSAFLVLVFNTVGLVILAHSPYLIRREIRDAGKHVFYYALALLMLCGFNGMLVTGDLFNLYVWLEICSLALYGLIAVGGRKAPVAAFRYLIMGTIGAGFYLIGLGFLFTLTGTLNMGDLAVIFPHIAGHPTAAVGIVFIVTGFGIKMALFPLHGWLPDAYTYAPSPSSALIAPLGTKVAAYVILRLLFGVFGAGSVIRGIPVTTAVGVLAAAGIVYGSILAIAQKELKRMLAYSSIAQIGYIGLGIGLGNALGFAGAVLHILNHAVMKGLLFMTAGHFRLKLGHSLIPRLDAGTRRRLPWTTAAFTVGALSMVGIPPTAGFFSKWYLALGSIQNSNWAFLAIILGSSLLNAVYFFRVLERIHLVRPGNAGAGGTGSMKHAAAAGSEAGTSEPKTAGHWMEMDRSGSVEPLTETHSAEAAGRQFGVPEPSIPAGGDTAPVSPAVSADDERDGHGAEPKVRRNEVGPALLIPLLIMAAAVIILGLLSAMIVRDVIMPMVPAGLQ